MAFRRVSTCRHTAKINHVPSTQFCRQGPCDGLTAVIVCCVPESGTRRTRALAHGELRIRRRLLAPLPSPWPSPPSCVLVCRVPGKKHTAKPALPSWLVAVVDSPWATHGEHVCRVFWGLRRVPWAHGEIVVSGSAFFHFITEAVDVGPNPHPSDQAYSITG